MNKKSYIFLLACLVILTGYLGKDELLTTAVAFGYGGGGGYTSPYVALMAPNGGQSLVPGSIYTISWSAGGSGLAAMRLMLSTDSGASYSTVIVASIYNGSYYNWIVPDVASADVRIMAEGLNSSGLALVSDSSDADFAILGTTPPAGAPPAGAPPAGALSSELSPEEAAAPAQDPNSSGSYGVVSATTATPTINVDKDIESRPGVILVVDPGSLIKGSQPAVYFYGRDGRRYVFPNQRNFFSWYADFGDVITISDELLATIPLGGNATYRPGVRMIKIQSDPKVYAVSRGGLLRWVTSEAAARQLYGDNWNQQIDDVSDAFFTNYHLGDTVTLAEAPLGSFPVTPTPPPVCSTTTAFTRFLSSGSTDAQVRPLQALLKCLGYIPAGVLLTGHFGPATEAAVREFQTDNGLDAFGYVGPGTRMALNRYVTGW